MADEEEKTTRKKRSPGGYDSHNLGGHTTHHGDGTATTTDNRGSISHYSGSDRRSSSHTHRGGGNGGERGDRHRHQGPNNAEIAAQRARYQQAHALLSQVKTLSLSGAMITPEALAHPVPVFSVAGVGSIALTDISTAALLAGLRTAISALASAGAEIAAATPMGFLVASAFYSPKVGIGSDKVPGRTLSLSGAMITPEALAHPVPVFSVAGVGSIALTDISTAALLAGLRTAISALASAGAEIAAATPMGFLVASAFYSPKVGIGSDKVPGRTPENFFSLALPAQVMNLPDKTALAQAANTAGTVNMPVRGVLTAEKAIDIKVVRHPTVQPVKVVKAKYDVSTGLYVHDVVEVPGGKLVTTPPVMADIPSLGPLITPIADVPVTVHTGGESHPPAVPITPFPDAFDSVNRDIILVYPDDAGMEPVYVMFNKPRKGAKPAGHDYHQPPKTQDITGFSGLIKKKGNTPKQGGSGKRDRWIDAKGRTIYEWDYQHGELEGYRASDGEHLGSFDPKTGQQSKPAVPGRNIKKYL
ncbi:colicin E3/pyocin S6 family cytotoxin [Symbiopectobacterium purcellii]|uniref:colicin E3/pyocin S6 family cytotoxin n=1 Tax=Symbiopectobacterium purcellii TaxID=2871826 RepID=UPI003F82F0EB